MTTQDSRLVAAVEDYLDDLRKIRASGGGTNERSYYPPLINLLNVVGGMLRTKVFCVSELVEQGAGHPDVGLYTGRQVQRGEPRRGQTPDCGVVEVKPATDDSWITAESSQVSSYWQLYRLVLVTNTHDFILLGEDDEGVPAKLEAFHLAGSVEEFEKRLQRPRSFAREVGAAFGEYLSRALSHRATLAEPENLGWLLASYARDGLSRVEAADDAASLKVVKAALEDTLGVRFEGERGSALFRSTLIQTLFYGVFSAWVLWARQEPPPVGRFNWRESVWHLRAPVLQALFQQLSSPTQLHSLNLVEVLDWTASALDRVNRIAFFAKFNEGEAVPYFYEPFLKAFDPELRKNMGVWYTPSEVVHYMVARVDRALKDDLGITDGLAANNVYILDPCCGTGAYLAQTIKRIAANLKSQGLGALTGARVKQAATERVFGFEIMPAPFVVSHLQVGLTLQELGAPLSEDGNERAGVFLTNSLTGWEPQVQKPLPFPELEEERERAERVKRDTPILVILGNPPYNAFAGMAVDEERELSETYRTSDVRQPKGHGLNDLYVRFFRMAERRIAEKTGRGIVCFISNYSWLDGLSYTGMRERYLDAFDVIRIDCLNGDRYKTGKKTPDGRTDPSIFSTPESPVGIQVGTAITTLIRNSDHKSAKSVGFRNLWGGNKLTELVKTAEKEPDELYSEITPVRSLGFPFADTAASTSWSEWPSLPEIFQASFPGVKTSHDSFLVDIDLETLRTRIGDFLSSGTPSSVPDEAGFVRYAYRPFDTRWLYWGSEGEFLDRPRLNYKQHVFDDNLWLEARQKEVRENFTRGTFVHDLADNFGNGLSSFFPAWLREEGLDLDGFGGQKRPNVTDVALGYLNRLGLDVEDLFFHSLAVLHDAAYRKANAGVIRMEWPRIPIPGWPHGDADGAREELADSAERGRELARLLNTDTPVPGVTSGALHPEYAAICVPATADGSNMLDDDFSLTAGWGHFGAGGVVMPGRGKVEERSYTVEERLALGTTFDILGSTTFDINLNNTVYWRNVPAKVWKYELGGYQVLKKWLSYRDQRIIGRRLKLEEVQHFVDTARRIAAIMMLTAAI